MERNNFEKRNGWKYNDESLKERIENNEFVNNIRKKLISKKIEKKFQKKSPYS